MSINQILATCHKRGVHIFLEGGALKASGDENQIREIAPLLKENREALITWLKQNQIEQLAPFNFNYAEDTPETERINNMAWEFMQVDGMSYAEAIKQAADIVKHCQIVACEAAYEDVRALWVRLKVAA